MKSYDLDDFMGAVDATEIRPIEEFYENTENNIFNKCDPPEVLGRICKGWVSGETYGELFEFVSQSGVVLSGKRPKALKMENLVEICDNSLSYEGALILGAVLELLPLVRNEGLENISDLIEDFQKKLKYGLPSRKAVILYELGFSDRVVAQQLTELLGVGGTYKETTIIQLNDNEEAVRSLLTNYPAYFQCKRGMQNVFPNSIVNV